MRNPPLLKGAPQQRHPSKESRSDELKLTTSVRSIVFSLSLRVPYSRFHLFEGLVALELEGEESTGPPVVRFLRSTSRMTTTLSAIDGRRKENGIDDN
jgi:hypothetical protein